eukprot:3932258-Rhodomonas_salina.4
MDISSAYALSGTDIASACARAMRCAYWAIIWCYAVCGTKLAYDAMRCAVLSWRMAGSDGIG